jgi:hypothetical protein
LSYLDIAGSPAHLRYLIRRLRQHAPGAPIILGLWPVGDPTVQDPKVQQMVGADVYVPGLRGAVDAAVAALRAAPSTVAAGAAPVSFATSTADPKTEPHPVP